MAIISPQLKYYYRECRAWREKHPRELSTMRLAGWYRRWHKSQNSGSNGVADRMPWVTFAAIDFLSDIVTSESRIFEWGSGGSTLFLANRCKELVTIEHNPEWHARLLPILAADAHDHCTLKLIQPKQTSTESDPAKWSDYGSGSPEFRQHCFRDYVAAIDEYKDHSFDLVIVDGRARPSCFVHALKKVREGGYVLWDDTNRDYYQPATQNAADRFRATELPGPKPYVSFFAKSTAWQRVA